MLRHLMWTLALLGGSLFIVAAAVGALSDEGPFPDLSGANGWLESSPLNRDALRGKVVLIDFWTYTCINSLRPLPYVKSWAEKYKDAGLVVIGVHTPEFSFEKERPNIEQAMRELKVTYPVAIDSDYNIWRAFDNHYWPAVYIIDGKGRIRYHHFGEGEYDVAERVIQKLLMELKDNHATSFDTNPVNATGQGVEAAPSADIETPETYVGYRQGEHFASPERLKHDSPQTYTAPAKLSLNQWGFGGSWNVGGEGATVVTPPGTIVFRFHSRDLHLVLAPTKDGQPVRFRVKLDGVAPGENHGTDADANGSGTVREPRLYQLIRQKGPIEDRTFEIEFLDPGARAFVFTFG